MKWVRSKIKGSSRLALLALAIQFAVSFGHFHPTAVPAGRAVQDVAPSAQQQPPAGRESDQQTSDACEVCALIALASTGLFATPPLLSLPQGSEFSSLTTDAGFAHLSSARAAFQPRAPPVS
jgi:hypothetical protein